MRIGKLLRVYGFLFTFTNYINILTQLVNAGLHLHVPREGEERAVVDTEIFVHRHHGRNLLVPTCIPGHYSHPMQRP